MTTGAPAGSLAQAAGGTVIGTADDNSGWRLLLEVAPETKIGIARDQHLVVHRAVRIVAGCATFPHRFMLEDERPALRRVALTAGIVLSQQRGPATLDGRALVR